MSPPRPSFIPRIDPTGYHYDLPEDRIAAQPLSERDESRLLVCRADDGTIRHRTFSQITGLIPPEAMLIANDTKVVRARILLHKPTGGAVEFFLLEPVEPSHDPAVALGSTGECLWRCLIGGAKKIRGNGAGGVFSLNGTTGTLEAWVTEGDGESFGVRFRWTPPELSFAEVLQLTGRIPLPPYIRRETTESDTGRYQTVYAAHPGAVAAPTAGLHFTSEILETLRGKGVAIERVTLHVGAGTFRPVKGRVDEHSMHGERLDVSLETLRAIAGHAGLRQRTDGAPFVLVGTTSVRTVESLYWFGVRLLAGEAGGENELSVGQWDPYRLSEQELPDEAESLDAVLEWVRHRGLDSVSGSTRMFILPGYRFHLCDALITNFHQPGSTLLLLVAALMGDDLMHRIYAGALAGGYRFLSYGDSSLLIHGRM